MTDRQPIVSGLVHALEPRNKNIDEEQIKIALLRMSAFGKLLPGKFSYYGGADNLTQETFVFHVKKAAIDGHNLEDIANKAIDLIETNTATFQRIFILNGIDPVPTELSADITILPISELKDAKIHAYLEKRKADHFVNPPSAILVCAYTASPAMVGSYDYRKIGSDSFHNKVLDIIAQGLRPA